MEIDQNNLRTEIAIGCRASQEFCSNHLLMSDDLRIQFRKKI